MRIKYTKQILQDAVLNAESYAGVLRHLGVKQAGGTQSHVAKKIKEFEIDVSHFKGQSWSKGVEHQTKREATDILILRSTGNRQKTHLLKRALLETNVKHECALCGQLPEWRGNPLTLDIDHINQNWLDDRIENLRFLCPNCHSQFSRNLIKD